MIYDSDYITRKRAVVRLFSKNHEKKIIYDENFEPYIYAIPEHSGVTEKIKKIEVEKRGEIIRVRDCIFVEKRYKGEEVKAIKIIFNHPQHVPVLRDEIKRFAKCYEYDIPFAKRYLIDKDVKPLDGDTSILKVLSFDIEVFCKEEPDTKKDPIIMISVAGEGFKKIFTWKKIDLDYVTSFSSEKEMISGFFDFLREFDGEVILTYNGDNFDFLYLKERCKNLKVKDGFWKKIEIRRRGFGKSARIPGLVHVDLYPISRKILNLSKYTLENVYLEYCGKEKSKIEPQKIYEYWKEEKNLKGLAKYSLEDAVATYEIGMQVLPLQYELARIVKQNLFDVSRSSFSNLVEYLLMKKAFERNEIVPNKKFFGRESYVGAFVLEPEKGLHENVVYLDFRSLYPTIIISHNVDPLTLGCSCCENQSPAGYNFCLKREGFIPQILKVLLEERAKIKAKMKEGDRILYSQQWALKILANSFYGYLAYSRSRWYCRECAESVTAWGRYYLKKIIKMAKDEGFEVVYGDTDSLFLKIPTRNLEKVEKFLEKVNENLPEMMELELEGFYERGFFVTKKKYALFDGKKILTKGLEIVRRDWAEIAKKTQSDVLNVILREGDIEKAVFIVKDVVKRIKSREVSIKDLVIYTQLTMHPNQYKNIEPHVFVAKRLIEEGYDVGAGSIISYVVRKGKGLIRDRALTLEEFLEGGYEYDDDYYVNNQVLPAVERVFKAFGYKKEDLEYERGEQKSLRDWF